MSPMAGSMALSFPALDRRVNRDPEALHDFLWHDRPEEEKSLASSLERDARDIDTFLRLGGRVLRNATPPMADLRTSGNGESLFELLGHTWALGAATTLAARKDFRGAATRARHAVASASIGVCANAGCFEFVQEWEGGKIDFETYTRRLADFLEPKGVLNAGQFKRMLDVVYDAGMNWNAVATKPEQVLAGLASIQAAAWCLLFAVSIRELLGAPPKFSSRDFGEIVERIAGRA